MKMARRNSSRFDKRWLLVIVLILLILSVFLFLYVKPSLSPTLSEDSSIDCFTPEQSEAFAAFSILPPPFVSGSLLTDHTLDEIAKDNPQIGPTCYFTVDKWIIFFLTGIMPIFNNYPASIGGHAQHIGKISSMEARGLSYKVYLYDGESGEFTRVYGDGTYTTNVNPLTGNAISLRQSLIDVLCDLFNRKNKIELFIEIEGTIHAVFLRGISCLYGTIGIIDPNSSDTVTYYTLDENGKLLDDEMNHIARVNGFGITKKK